MMIGKQVCSFEDAKKLKELKVVQDSLWWWDIFHTEPIKYNLSSKPRNNDSCSAFTVAELGELLPAGVNINKKDYAIQTGKMSSGIKYCGLYCSDEGIEEEFFDKVEVNVRAKMLLYLLENKVIDKNGKVVVKKGKMKNRRVLSKKVNEIAIEE